MSTVVGWQPTTQLQLAAPGTHKAKEELVDQEMYKSNRSRMSTVVDTRHYSKGRLEKWHPTLASKGHPSPI